MTKHFFFSLVTYFNYYLFLCLYGIKKRYLTLEFVDHNPGCQDSPLGEVCAARGGDEGVHALDYLGGFVFQKESFFKSGTDHINKSIIESPVFHTPHGF